VSRQSRDHHVHDHHVHDRGAADALGLVLIAPVAIGLAVLVIALGRGVDARAQVRSAAAAGAQAAALERSPSDAERAATVIVAAMLVDDDACTSPDVTVDYPSTPAPGSATAFGTVRVTVRCSVSDRGIELLGTGPGDEEFTATATIDLFTSREAP
jgi:Flp pilus assembly protein TadG